MTIRHGRVSKRLIAVAAAAATAATMFAIPMPASAAQTLDPTVRLQGATRYGTAAAIANAVGCSSDIILASGQNQPDALAAAALARTVNAPILLTPANALAPEASSVIGTCAAGGAQTVHILGGEAAVSAGVAAAVDALPGTVTVNRIAGANRYETAVKVAETITPGAIGSFLSKRTAIVASGTSFVDALAAGPISYRGVIGGAQAGPHPILLTAGDALTPATDAALTSLGIQQVVIVGGTAVVSDAVQTAIAAKGITVIRQAGANRYDTAAVLAKTATTAAGLGGFGFDGVNVGLANGTNAFGGFDALASAPYLGKAGAPLTLVTTNTLPAETDAFLVSKATTIKKLHIFGGLAAVDAATQTAAEKAATLVTPTGAITANQAQLSFTVVFSEPVLTSTVGVVDFSLNNGVGAKQPNAILQVVDPVGTVAATQVATTFVVGVSAALAVGDSVRVNSPSTVPAGEIKTPDGRIVGSTSVTVAADTTKPVATILAAVNNNTFRVKFSEPVTTATANVPPAAVTNYTAIDGQSPANPLTVVSAALDVATNTVATVTVSRNLLPGDRVGIANNVIADLAGNLAVAQSATVQADNINPTLLGATVKTTDTATAQLIVDGTGNFAAPVVATSVKYVSKLPGVTGNTITVSYTDVGATATENVTVTGTAIVVRTRTGGSTPAQVAAAVTANVNSSPLVTAEAVNSASTSLITSFVGLAPLAGGSSNVTVVATFSETVKNVGYGLTVQAYQGGAAISTGITSGTITGTPVDGTSNVYTYTITGANVRPGTAAQFLATTGVQDLANNNILANTAVTMTVAS